MIFRSKAPLRLGLGGGGTDVSPYCNLYGGAVLNATISLYAHASIELLPKPEMVLAAHNSGVSATYALQEQLPIEGALQLLQGVYNAIQQDHPFRLRGLKLSTYTDVPPGSGLGTSSTLVVAILGAFTEMLGLPLGEYDLAHYACEIERNRLQLAGGRQDQFAATFGGINFMEFFESDKVIVNPLRIKPQYLRELESNLVLYFTGTSRSSAAIIKQQASNVVNQHAPAINAMHQLKQQAHLMKEALLGGRLQHIGAIMNMGYAQKKQMAAGIANPLMEAIYEAALEAGATGGKISGAGGGGFMLFYCPGSTKFKVLKSLEKFGGTAYPFAFVDQGMSSWTAVDEPGKRQ